MKTVWSRNALPLTPARFRSLYTVVLPVVDVSIILFGLSSLLVGSHLVDKQFTAWFSPAWAVTTLVGAAVALAGLVLLHDLIELIGRFAIGIGLVIYLAATVFTIGHGDASALLTLLLTVARIVPTIWRINDLAGEIARKDAAHDR